MGGRRDTDQERGRVSKLEESPKTSWRHQQKLRDHREKSSTAIIPKLKKRAAFGLTSIDLSSPTSLRSSSSYRPSKSYKTQATKFLLVYHNFRRQLFQEITTWTRLSPTNQALLPPPHEPRCAILHHQLRRTDRKSVV